MTFIHSKKRESNAHDPLCSAMEGVDVGDGSPNTPSVRPLAGEPGTMGPMAPALTAAAVRTGAVRGRYFRENFAQGGIARSCPSW